jgi:hypothetical protein
VLDRLPALQVLSPVARRFRPTTYCLRKPGEAHVGWHIRVMVRACAIVKALPQSPLPPGDRLTTDTDLKTEQRVISLASFSGLALTQTLDRTGCGNGCKGEVNGLRNPVGWVTRVGALSTRVVASLGQGYCGDTR